MLRVGSCIVVLVAACTTPAPTGEIADPVTGGALDTGDPAVVALVAGGAVGCTGTLVGGHTVITAAHCVAGIDAGALRVFAGSAVPTGAFADVSDVRVDPGFEPATLLHDLALVTVRQQLPAAPLAIDPRGVDASFVGMAFRVVGFGLSDATADDAGVKRDGTAQVSAIAADELTATPAPSQPCRGDSGGPALFADAGTTYVTAVVSHGDPACTDHAVYARIDVARATFVDPYLAETAPGTVHVGDACLYDGQCGEGPCLQTTDDPSLFYCSASCARDEDCPDAMTCAADGCRYELPSPHALGSACAIDADCTSDICYLGSESTGVCTVSCLADPESCGDGFECVVVDGLEHDCLATVPSGGGCQAGPAGSPSEIVIVLAVVVARRRRRSSRV